MLIVPNLTSESIKSVLGQLEKYFMVCLNDYFLLPLYHNSADY